MSRVNNAYVAIAALACGLVVESDAKPVCAGLLNDVQVNAVNAAEVTDKGKCIVLVTMVEDVGGVPTQVVRPVADANGNVKLYADGAAVVALAKTSNLQGGEAVTVVKRAVSRNIGDPVSALKSQHKSASTEAAQAAKPLATLTTQVTAAESLGWDDAAVGSEERAEYDDLVTRKASVTEWHDKCVARVATLAAALTAAGIDPTTYLPLPSGG